jgi:Ca2+-transporting ATPase
MQGLSDHEVVILRKKYGLNVIEEKNKTSFIRRFFSQFRDFLTLLLLIAAFLSFLIGEAVDGGLILAIVILNACFGLYQEYKAENAIISLKKITATLVRVIRNGHEKEIDSRELVPGDIIFVEEGIKIPADAQVIEAKNLEINEAILTGESMPVPKNEDEEVYMGTFVAKGRGYIKVTKIGMATKFGEIAAHLAQIDDTLTPLQRKLARLSRFIGYLGIAAALVVFALSFFKGDSYFSAFLLAIALAVAIVPEGLPAVMTVTLSIGVKEMAKRKAIIRRLAAIEALGNITLIATDKTGTLTSNQMKVKEVFVNEKIFSSEVLPHTSSQAFSKLLLNGILCSTASLVYVHDHGSWDVLGDPTEGALLYLGQKVGLNYEEIRRHWKVVDEKPFDSITKKMVVTVLNKQQEQFIFTKGAPEAILTECEAIEINNQILNLSSAKKEQINQVLAQWAKKGLRVLGFSYKKDSSSKTIFLGMVAIHDPPRPEVREAISKTKKAGFKVVMITGDNEKTAEAIGVSIGLVKEGDEIMIGQQLEDYSDEQLLEILPRVKIFARTNPQHKYRIVKLYQKLGETVAVTGDGVNDAIALKQADVGIAMGLVGTDVARETADMVLTDDNFASIVNAIEEGRNIIRNLQNAIKYLLSCNISEALALIMGLVLNIPHLFFAVQLLYVNLVTDGLPALALAFSPKDTHILSKKSERQLNLLKKTDKQYIFLVGILATILILSGYFLFAKKDLGQTAAFSILVIIQAFILIDLWLSHHSIRHYYKRLFKPIFLGAFILPFLTQLAILKIPYFAYLFRIKTVTWIDYFCFIGLAFGILIAVRWIKKALKIANE